MHQGRKVILLQLDFLLVQKYQLLLSVCLFLKRQRNRDVHLSVTSPFSAYCCRQLFVITFAAPNQLFSVSQAQSVIFWEPSSALAHCGYCFKFCFYYKQEKVFWSFESNFSVATKLPHKGPESAGFGLQTLQVRTRLQNDLEIQHTAPALILWALFRRY